MSGGSPETVRGGFQSSTLKTVEIGMFLPRRRQFLSPGNSGDWRDEPDHASVTEYTNVGDALDPQAPLARCA